MCGCRKGKAGTGWIHTAPNGDSTKYNTELEARREAAKVGGTVRPA